VTTAALGLKTQLDANAAAKATAAAAAATQSDADKRAYEAAYLAVLKQQAVVDAAKPEDLPAEQYTLLLDKQAANRAAAKIGVKAPFPDAGLGE
jgi:hypothetical protein